jgi:hypothetical protein
MDAARVEGVTAEAREEVEAKAPVDNRRSIMREAQNRSRRHLPSPSSLSGGRGQ